MIIITMNNRKRNDCKTLRGTGFTFLYIYIYIYFLLLLRINVKTSTLVTLFFPDI